ncbi:MBL fold metallo-hydrolase [Mycobacterium sp. shizuoka-1]|uniref:MBL fold metallo-hydrolase n=1 Tax=Mycobacterium sp. shizuoka-1 TaxID=2039281 RepID=UPI000C066C3F|nr:MBL fold metallo-hydrolase [Mycobacterium sp. shizuoka-1]GAY19176.1 MBL fold metallo-hydrolase [Mycobacterium sp. shizuoka-1]
MRLKLGRPDIDRYRSRFDVPAAAQDAALSITWLGVSTVLVDDGTTALLTDGFFSRPSLLDVGLRRLKPSDARIDYCLNRAGINRLAAVLPVHTHFDHAMDSAVVAARTGARLIGGESAANIARGHRLPDDQILLAASGEELTLGPFAVTLVESHHCPPDRFPGAITTPVGPPAKASAFRCGETWSTLIHHTPSDRRLLIQGSAGFVPGALDGRRADVAYLGIGQLGVQPQSYLEQYWEHTVTTVGARRVVLIHWDDFFRPLTAPMVALPYAGDDLDVSMRVLSGLAERDGVAVHLPTVWRREDPWT